MSRDPLEEQEYEQSLRPSDVLTREEALAAGVKLPDDATGAALYGAHRESLTEFRARYEKSINAMMDAAQQAPGRIYFLGQPEYPKTGISKHKVISLWKSGLRIGGTLLGCWVFRHSLPSVIVFLAFGVAEVLGIIEENHEND